MIITNNYLLFFLHLIEVSDSVIVSLLEISF